MKRIICFFLIISLFPCLSFAEYPLSSNEQNYIGTWSMYADNGNGNLYVIFITFLDNMEVVQKSLKFENNKLVSDNKASGIWAGFTENSILLTLAGSDMAAIIKDDGYLYLSFFKEMQLCGIYSKCEDMTSVLGW